ncbi:hypothetical protein AX16_008845 [Volvariella volvacea WC 439]|nr:hypothetical protein AX16_008845 [Volvariella volvacea WC 439]
MERNSSVLDQLPWHYAIGQGEFTKLNSLDLGSKPVQLLATSTEEVARCVGPTIAGLLNATFGNAVEAIVGIVALFKGDLDIIKRSMLGSILSNILLVLGCSFIAGSFKESESSFTQVAAQVSSSLMTLAVITMAVPAVHSSSTFVNGHFTTDTEADREDQLIISRVTAVILLLVYFQYLYFQLKSHSYLFDDTEAQNDENEGQAKIEEEPLMNKQAATVSLLAITLLVGYCADILLDSVETVAHQSGLSVAFIGMILIPFVANAAEHVSAVIMARKGKMELAVSICVGSSIQIATFVFPLLVVVGWIIDRELSLVFTVFDTVVSIFSVMLVNTLVQDGKSNYMEGVMLLALYGCLAFAYSRIEH